MPAPITDLASFFDVSPHPCLAVDRELTVVAANRAYLALVGRDLTDIDGREVGTVFPADPATREQVTDSIRRVLRTGRPDTVAVPRFGPAEGAAQGGSARRHWSVTHVPVRDRSGHVTHVLQQPTEVTTPADPATLGALTGEREELARLFDQAPSFMAMLVGPDHRFVFANPEYMKVVGHRPIVGLTVADALGEAAEQGYVALLDRVYASGEAYRAEGARFDIQAEPDGPVDGRYLDFVYQPLRDNAGRVSGIFVQGIDVTERTRAAAALDATERRYRSVLEAIDVGFCIMEMIFEDDRPVDYRFIEVNTAFENQTGLVDAPGRTARELVPDLESHWFERYGSVASTGEAIRFENGSEAMGRWFDVHALRIGPPELRRVAVLFNDITARRQLEIQLRNLNAELEQRVEERSAALRLYQNIVQSDESPVVAFDTDMRITAFNRAHREAYRRACGIEQQVGDSLLEGIDPEQAEVLRGFMARALAGESFIVRQPGDPARDTPPWQVAYNPLRKEDGTIVGGFHHALDISSELKAQADLEKTQDALRQAQKMEAVGQLTGGLAHDFNNLLTGMMGNLELLQNRLARGRVEDLERFILAALGAGRRAASLTQRLLAFSRRQTLDPRPTDVNRLIAGMEELLRRTMGPSNEIEVVGAEGLWAANIDAGQLENALLNLCINARDAMPGGGRLTIETANKWFDERAAGERDLPPGPYLAICVTDTGTGMTEETIGRAFEPFFTTKPLGEGTGLGLSMIYGFARQSNGQVRIRSELGVGTTICIYLPRFVGDAPPPDQEPAVTGAPAASGGTVLVVDDEATIRDLIDEVLDECGYTVIGAADGAAGLKILQSGARIDLLVTDVGLPGGLNGRQVADAARALRPGLKVLFITGYAEKAAFGNGHLEPGMQLLTKPFTMEALSAKVADVMKER